MHEHRYSDAGHSGLTSEASSDTVIELVNLEDQSLEHRRHSKDDDDFRETEEVFGEDDDADNALLLPRDHSPGEERSPSPTQRRDTSTWKEALRIVIEVCPHACKIWIWLN